MNWSLFIDESGDFISNNDDVVVAGVLLCRDIPALDDLALKSSIQSTLPHIPWPIHTAHLRNPLCQVLWYSLPQNSPLDPDFAKIIQEAYRHIESSPEFFRLFSTELEAINNGIKSDLPTIWDLWNKIRFPPTIRQALKNKAQADNEALVAIIEHLWLYEPNRDLPVALAYVCGEEYSASSASLMPNRYRELLTMLLERVVDVLAELGGTHFVELMLQQRYLYEDQHIVINRGSLIDNVILPLGKIFEQRLQNPPTFSERGIDFLFRPTQNSDTITRIKVIPWKTIPFNAHVGGAHVIVDFLANNARQLLKKHIPLRGVRATGLEWHPGLEDTLFQNVPIPSRITSVKGSLIAAVPQSQTQLRLGREQSWNNQQFQIALGSARGRFRQWAIDQAIEWL
jgi:hypothetical protein